VAGCQLCRKKVDAFSLPTQTPLSISSSRPVGEMAHQPNAFPNNGRRKLLGKIEAHFCGMSWGNCMFTHVLKVLAGTCNAFRRLSEI
jgi:hypothetical protein